MRNRVGLILVLALACGGLAAYLAFSYLGSPTAGTPSASNPQIQLVQVATAARDMPVGTVLQPEDVKMVDWPAGAVPAGYADSPDEVIGRGLIAGVKQHEPLLSSKLALKEAGGGLPIAIPDGKRAMSIKVDDVAGVAGFVLPGTRVDVIVTLTRGGKEGARSRIFLQDIQVLTAGQTVQRDPQGQPKQVPVVTLLVDPAQGEKLALASTQGRIQLALRNTLDTEEVETPGVQTAALISNPSPPTQKVVRRYVPRGPSHLNIEVYRGPEKKVSTVEASGG